MKAIVNTAPGKLAWLDWPMPEPGPGQVRIRTSACGICATDLVMVAGWKRTHYPVIPGHEWSGRVAATGPGVDPALKGRLCVASNVLSDGGEVGFEHPGGYAEYLITEAVNVYVLPDDFPADVAALIEPLAVAVRGCRRLQPQNLSCALVLGDGPIGLMMVLLLRRAGVVRIMLVGGRQERLSLAATFGAVKIINYHDLADDFTAALAKRVGREAPNVIEASGSINALRAALELTADEGRILLLGEYGTARADFPWMRMVLRQYDLIGANASAGAWPEAVRLAGEWRNDLRRLISHRLPAGEFERGMTWIRERKLGLIKLILEWATP